MTDQHPAVAHLLAAHVKAEALAEAASCTESGCRCRSWQNFDMDGELRDDRNAGTIASIPHWLIRAHIALHDPASVLRRVAAERDLLAEHSESNGDCSTCVDGKWGYPIYPDSSPQRYPCRTVLGLAAGWGWEAR